MTPPRHNYLRLNSSQHVEILNKQILHLEVQLAETEADLARLEGLPEEIRDATHEDQVRQLRHRIAQLDSGIATTADQIDAVATDRGASSGEDPG
jgi:predicted  nucleic acid-binding Zn-ribbon protein